jgi:hypothetical protein
MSALSGLMRGLFNKFYRAEFLVKVAFTIGRRRGLVVQFRHVGCDGRLSPSRIVIPSREVICRKWQHD